MPVDIDVLDGPRGIGVIEHHAPAEPHTGSRFALTILCSIERSHMSLCLGTGLADTFVLAGPGIDDVVPVFTLDDIVRHGNLL
jgi:hypothetical protein